MIDADVAQFDGKVAFQFEIFVNIRCKCCICPFTVINLVSDLFSKGGISFGDIFRTNTGGAQLRQGEGRQSGLFTRFKSSRFVNGKYNFKLNFVDEAWRRTQII